MTTLKLTVEEISKRLESKNLSALIGVEETADFEFRQFSYLTTLEGDVKNKSQFELVRDITSIANSGGGLVAIGLKPLKKATEKKEYVAEICGVKKEHIQTQSWFDVLAEMVVPRFSETYLEYGFSGANDEVFWFKIKDAKEVGCFPFILTKDQWEPTVGEYVKGTVFGYYYRDGAQNVWLSAEKLQQYIADGIRAKQTKREGQIIDPAIATQLQGINIKLEAMASQVTSLVGAKTEQTKEDLDNKEKKIVEYINSKLEWETGFFYIYAVPKKPANIKDFWNQGKRSVYETLKSPPYLRPMGWDMQIASSEYPEPKDGFWQAMNGDRKINIVTREGEMLTAATIDEFLDWGLKSEDPNKKLINNFPLVEYIDNFFHFFYVSRKIFSLKRDYTVRMGFITKDGINYYLQSPAGIGDKLFGATSGPLNKKKWSIDIPENDDRWPNIMAAEAVIEIYASGFGITEENFAYLKKENGSYQVDEELYKKQT